MLRFDLEELVEIVFTRYWRTDSAGSKDLQKEWSVGLGQMMGHSPSVDQEEPYCCIVDPPDSNVFDGSSEKFVQSKITGYWEGKIK